MDLVASMDFEFRSGTDIALGLPRYFADPEAAPLCLAYDMGDGCGAALYLPGQADPEVLLDHVRRGGKVRAWNVMFEWHVWNLIMVPQYGWPELRIEQCIDSMAEAAAMNLPQGLGNACAALDLPAEFQKDKRGSQLIKLLCIPQAEPKVQCREQYKSDGAFKGAQTRHRTWLAKGGRWLSDASLLTELYAYCLQDVVAELAVVRKLRRLTEYEQRVWVRTQVINLRGVPIDRKDIANISAVVQVECDRLNGELSVLTAGEVNRASEAGALRDWCNARLHHDLYMADIASDTVDALLLKDEAYPGTLPPEVKRALQIRGAVSQTSTAKLPKMLLVAADDNTLKNMHIFHGASTGRDASRGGVNLQNLKSPLLEGEQLADAFKYLTTGDHDLCTLVYGDSLMDAAVSLVRGVIKAPEGYEFTDGDFSSVENRVSAWVAGQHDKLQLFRDGLDEYKTFATKLFHIEYSEVTAKQRKFCKPPVLGGMFGLGALGLVGYAAGMGVHMELKEAQTFIDAYRDEYDRVAACWKLCNAAMLNAVRTPDKWFNAGPHLALCVWRGYLWMRLPSGRKLAWAQPRIEQLMTPWGELRDTVTVKQVDQFTHQFKRDKLIGSSAFQSGVQAIARDLLMHACFNVEDKGGYQVVLRVHDELLSLNPIGYGSCDEFGSLMCEAPPWAPDLPLAFSAWRDSRFRK